MEVKISKPRTFLGHDGARLAYRSTGTGSPLILLHGYLATASTHWVHPGHTALLAAHGHQVVMPDMRGHGASSELGPYASYAADVLADDVFALLGHLGIRDCETWAIAGYSLGARTVIRLLIRGARPRRAVVAGQGLGQITGAASGSIARFTRHVIDGWGTFRVGTPEWKTQCWIEKIGADPVALLRIPDCDVPSPIAQLAEITVPTLVVAGVDDERSTSAGDLADALPAGHFASIPGNHTTAVSTPELGEALRAFLIQDI